MKKTKKVPNRVLLDVGKPSEQETQLTTRVEIRIVGQRAAKEMMGRAHACFLNPLRDKRRPIYVAALLGEPGNGKTLTAEELALFYHGDPTAMIKVNCGAYKEKHRVSQLLGAPPSYVGYKDPTDPKDQPKPGQMDTTAKLSMHNKVASRKGSPVPVTIVLLDEIEKLHEDLEDVLLSIFDKAEVDFGNNTTGYYGDCIFLLAGNLGSDKVRKLANRMGFHVSPDRQPTHEEIVSTINEELESRYKPEFVDRIDEVVIYETLTATQKRAVVDVEIAKLEERIMAELPRGLQFTLSVDEAARDFVLSRAMEKKGSSRRIKRVLNQLIEKPLGNEIVKKTIMLGDLVEITHEEGSDKLSFYKVEGEGEIADADRLVVSGPDSPAAQAGLGFQRQVDKAIKKAAKSDKALFEVTLTADSQSQLAVDTRDLINELTNVFGIAIVETSNSWEAPWVLRAVVRAIPDQMELFQKKNPLAAVKAKAETSTASK